MATTTFQDSLFHGDADFWERYVKGRPVFPDSIFERIFKYHAEHNGQFGVAHDAGAGGGVHSLRLATRFVQVIVSDPGEANIETAKAKLTADDSSSGGTEYSFRVAKVEQADDLAPASVDMIFLACVMHLTDLPKAFDAIARQLKPGGTMVVIMASIPFFEEQRVQGAFCRLYSAGSGRMIEKALAHGANLDSVAEIGFSAYDSIVIPQDQFEPKVNRIKQNWPGDMAWHRMGIPAHLDERFPYVSRLGSNDYRIEETNNDWTFQGDISQIEDSYNSVPFPSLTEDEIMSPLWKEVQAIVGDRKVKGVWPASLILATRKGQHS